MTESTDPKTALRPRLRALRDAMLLDLAPGERERLESVAAENLMPLIQGARCVAFYHALGSEIGCGSAIAAAAAAGIATALPHVGNGVDRAMDFLAWSPGDPIEAGWRGLMQPVADAARFAPDIIVTPLLGFDSGCRRIGQGGGFYDRALEKQSNIVKIGFAWSVQQWPDLPVDPWDQPLDAVVTERGVLLKGSLS